DKVDLSTENIKVSPDVCKESLRCLDSDLRKALEFAIEGIRAFHEKQKRTGFVLDRDGAVLEQRIRPLKRIGAYVPGGQAVYPSTMLMNIIPAQVAGVEDIVVCTPPVKVKPEEFVPFAVAEMLGVSDRIFQAGGA